MRRDDISTIDLNLFVVFEAIVREGSVSRAARALSLTQPAVSHALARLRERLGDPLFVRRGREMVPTPRARSLVEPVREALAGLRRCLAEGVDFDPSTAERTLVLGLRDGLEACVLPSVFARLEQVAPGLDVQSVTIARRDLMQELSTGRLDLAMDVQLPTSSEVVQQPALEDKLVVMMRARHPLARGRLSLERYLAARHAVVSSRRRGPSLEDFGLAQYGHHRRVALRCQHYQAAMEVVAQSDLLLTLPSMIASRLGAPDRFTTRKLPLNLPAMGLFLYWHRDQHDDPAHRWGRELLLNGLREVG